MTIETVNQNVKRLRDYIDSLVDQINEINQNMLIIFFTIAITIAIAIIIAEIFFIKFLKKSQKEIRAQSKDIEAIKEKLNKIFPTNEDEILEEGNSNDHNIPNNTADSDNNSDFTVF